MRGTFLAHCCYDTRRNSVNINDSQILERRHRHNNRPLKGLVALSVVTVFGAAACGDDDDGPSTTVVEPVTSVVTGTTVVTVDSEVTVGTTVTSEVEVTDTTTQVSEVVVTEP